MLFWIIVPAPEGAFAFVTAQGATDTMAPGGRRDIFCEELPQGADPIQSGKDLIQREFPQDMNPFAVFVEKP